MGFYRLSAQADEDLIGIWLFISKDSIEAADRLIAELVKKFELVAEHPEAGRERPELYPNLRSFPVGRHILFYRPTPDAVEIVRILHSSRDIESLF